MGIRGKSRAPQDDPQRSAGYETDDEAEREAAIAGLFGPLVEGERQQPIAQAAAGARIMAQRGAAAASVPTSAPTVAGLTPVPLPRTPVRTAVPAVAVPVAVGAPEEHVATGTPEPISAVAVGPHVESSPGVREALPLAEATEARPRPAAKPRDAETHDVPAKARRRIGAAPRTSRPARRSVGRSRTMGWGVVAASVIIGGAVAIAGTLTVQSAQARDQLAAAVADVEEAEALIPAAQRALDAATADYAALGAERTEAVAAVAPVLARLVGMSDDAARAAAQTALDALSAEVDATPAGAPADYTRGDVDSTDLEALGAAVEDADAYRQGIESATSRVRADAAAREERIGAVQSAVLALGATLPSSADRIVAENPLPPGELRDAAIAAAAAAAAADDRAASLAAMDAYTAAVAALRDEQARMAAEQQRLRELQEQRAPQGPRSQPTKNSTPDLGAAPGQAPASPAPAAPVPQPDAQAQPEPQQPQPQAPQPQPEPDPGPGDDWPWGDWPFPGSP
jgi:hypothetical protein